MSSAYKGFWLNGSRETGYTAEAFKGPRIGEKLKTPDGKVLRTTDTAIKAAIREDKKTWPQ